MALADKARETLIKLHRERPSALLDPQHCRGLLLDFLPGNRLEVFILSSVVRENVLRENAPPGINRVVHLADCLRRKLGFAEDVARWSAESWALACGWVAEGDVLIPVQCPVCQRTGRADGTWRGKIVICPNCTSQIAFDNDFRPAVKAKGKRRGSTKGTGGWLIVSPGQTGGTLQGQHLQEAINEILYDRSLTEGDKAMRLNLQATVAVLEEEVHLVLNQLDVGVHGRRLGTKDLLVGVLRGFQPFVDGLRVYGESGAEVTTALSLRCDIPADEELVGEIPFLAFGSEQCGVIFGSKGIYYRNAGEATQPGPGMVSYSDLSRDRSKSSGLQELTLGSTDKVLYLGQSGVPKVIVLQLLSVIHHILQSPDSLRPDLPHA